MLESTPSEPYGGSIRDFLKVEGNMALRRRQAAAVLGPGEVYVTMTTFPRCKYWVEGFRGSGFGLGLGLGLELVLGLGLRLTLKHSTVSSIGHRFL